MYNYTFLVNINNGMEIPIIFSKEVIFVKFAGGLLTGMVLTVTGCIAWTLLFPNSKEEMCHAIKKISKDMKKDVENMM